MQVVHVCFSVNREYFEFETKLIIGSSRTNKECSRAPVLIDESRKIVQTKMNLGDVTISGESNASFFSLDGFRYYKRTLNRTDEL